ncbi:NB-ARC domain-containing protein [Amycolatopsis sp. H20-H5]|uniref:NB-ARC domain-containing protein n=1 Tax=Amycolatopsis sp. H20-H5 TaxID=3046309 RepID=UPI002DBF565B|nr:NB-ARC domain-containing protein [Amycolatopsis sp. H20-H5]MEC3978865.1 NB-ARC domain-containing protein [Amycolatopsis sp. H20-H5]
MTKEFEPVRSLPALTGTYSNRQLELAQVLDWYSEDIAAGKPTLVSVLGPQGIGKSTFALAACLRIAGDLPDVQLYCDAHGSDPEARLSAGQLVVRLLGLLGMAEKDIPADDDGRFAEFRSRLSQRRVLLLLDDINDVEQVRPLLFPSSSLVVVVTSRRTLESLQINDFRSLKLDKFTAEAAGELLGKVAGQVVRHEQFAVVNEICEGLPIALSIVAVRLRDPDYTPEEYVDEFLGGRSLELLELDGKRPVIRIFDLMYDELDETEAKAYELLGLAPGPDFGVGVAAAVLGEPVAAVKRTLDRLAKGFVLERTGKRRYRYHSLIREHAKEKLLKAWGAAEREAAVSRAVEWYWRLEVSLDRSLSGRPDPVPARSHYAAIPPAFTGDNAALDAAPVFALEWSNLVAAAKAVTKLPSHELTVLFPLALWYFGYQTGRVDEVIEAYEGALGLVAGPPAEWQFCRDLAGLHEKAREYDTADSYIARALAAEYPPGLASAYEWYGLAQEGRGEPVKAVELFLEARKAVPLMDLPDEHERAYALLDMHAGRVQFKLQASGEAHSWASATYEYFRRCEGENANKAQSGALLGRIRRDLGQPADEVVALFVPALEAFVALQMWEKAAELADELFPLTGDVSYQARAEEYRAKLTGE